MKVTFIYPKFEKFLESVEKMSSEREFFTVGKFTCPPSLGIPILASVTPGDVEINFVDDNAGEKIDFDDGTDIYAINSFTPGRTSVSERVSSSFTYRLFFSSAKAIFSSFV